jgi:ribosomal protein L7Ae-like RNA K-turn-binding protein
VWVHPSLACVKAATDKGGLARALKREVRLESAWLAGVMRDAIGRRIEGLLLSASRKRALAVGTDATRDALGRSAVEALVIAADAAGRRDELAASASRLGRHAVVFSTKSSLGRLFGRDEVGVIGILDGGIAAEVVESGQRLVDLSEAE